MPITTTARQKARELKILPERLEFLEEKIQEWMTEGRRQTMTLAISRYGERIFEGAYGRSGPDESYPPAPMDQIFCVASITKPIIAACLLKLQEDGIVDFSEKVTSFLPEFTGKDVEIWHLLTHTSGYSHEYVNEAIEKRICEELGVALKAEWYEDEELWNKIMLDMRQRLGLPDVKNTERATHDTWSYLENQVPPEHEPHTVMSYYNTGYNIAKDILVEICKKPIDEIAGALLFEPLGMVDSHFILPKEKWDRVVVKGEGCQGYPWHNSPEAFVRENGAGGLKSTANDLMRFCEMILNNGIHNGKRILSPISVRCMRTDYNGNLNPYDRWTIGLGIRADKTDTLGFLRPPSCLDHGGYGGSFIVLDPQTGLCISMLSAKQGEGNGVIPYVSNIVHSALAEL